VRIHRNARLTPASRRLLVERVETEAWTVADAAEAAGVSERTAYKWLKRWRRGDQALEDRSSAPRRVWNRTPAGVEQVIETLRRTRMTAAQIATALAMAMSTVTAVLQRVGLAKLSRLEPPEPPNRYCRRHPGELVHVDVKKLGRFRTPGHRVTGDRRQRSRRAGWDYVHVCIDDCSRVAYVEILQDETGPTAAGFLDRAVAFFSDLGVRVRRVMSDNAKCYHSSQWARTCRAHRVRPIYTKPYRPRTNGKAERFIRTMLQEWAYVMTYRDDRHRRRCLQPWVRHYNRVRPHGSLKKRTPMSRLAPSP